MKQFADSITMLGFFTLISFAIWWTDSLWGLIGLLLIERVKVVECDCEDREKE